MGIFNIFKSKKKKEQKKVAVNHNQRVSRTSGTSSHQDHIYPDNYLFHHHGIYETGESNKSQSHKSTEDSSSSYESSRDSSSSWSYGSGSSSYGSSYDSSSSSSSYDSGSSGSYD